MTQQDAATTVDEPCHNLVSFTSVSYQGRFLAWHPVPTPTVPSVITYWLTSQLCNCSQAMSVRRISHWDSRGRPRDAWQTAWALPPDSGLSVDAGRFISSAERVEE